MKNPPSPLITITRGTRILPALIAGLLASSDAAFAGRVEPPLAVISTNSPVNFGQPIILNGQRSRVDPSTVIVNYNWTLLSGSGNKAFPVGTSVDTSDSKFEVPISAADPFPLGSPTFQLVVTDKLGNDSAPATASVSVRDTFAPTAILDAPATVEFDQDIVLDASRSADAGGGQISSYRWTLLSGGATENMTTNVPVQTQSPSFTVQMGPGGRLPLGRHDFQLVVTDDSGNTSAPATTQVIVRDTTAPTAILDAPATVEFDQDIVLDASRSADTGGGQISSYRWRLLSGGATENMTTNVPVQTQSPSFTVQMGPGGRLPIGRHDFQLVVTDDSGNTSSPATTQVIVRDTTAPTAILDAPATVEFDQDIVLDASRSADTGGGQISSYRWTLLSGGATENMTTNVPVQTQSPSFTVQMGPGGRLPLGRHNFQLVVTDDSGNNSAPATTQVIVRDTTAPTAILDAPATVEFDQDIVLDASRSADAGGGQISRYTWTLLSGGAAENINTNVPVQSQSPSFTVQMGPGGRLPLGRHNFQLVVTDDSGNTSTPASVWVVIEEITPTEFVPQLSSLKQGNKLTVDWNPAPPVFRSVEVWKTTDLNQWELEITLPGDASTHTLNTPRTGPLFVRLIFIR